MKIDTTTNENEAFQFSTERAVALAEKLNQTHHNNSFQVEFNALDDTAIIGIYDSDYEICGFVSADIKED